MTRLEIENKYAFLKATLEEPNPVDFAIEISNAQIDEAIKKIADNRKTAALSKSMVITILESLKIH